MLNVTISADYERYWCYNVIVICGGFSDGGEQLFVVGDEVITSEEVTPLGGDKLLPPIDFHPSQMTVNFECEMAHRLVLNLNIIPHLLPFDGAEDEKPFEVEVVVRDENEVLYIKNHEVDLWSGISENIDITC